MWKAWQGRTTCPPLPGTVKLELRINPTEVYSLYKQDTNPVCIDGTAAPYGLSGGVTR